MLHGKSQELEQLAREVRAQAAEQGDRALEAEATNRLGEALFELFRYDEAHGCFVEALQARSALFGAGHLSTTRSVACLAAAAWAIDRAAEGRAMRRRALAAVPAEPLPEQREDVATVLRHTALVEPEALSAEDTYQLYRRSLGLVEGMPQPDELVLASTYVGLGRSEHATARDEAAAEHFERAYEIRVRLLGEEHLYVAYALHHLGAVKMKRRDFDGARELTRRSLEMVERCGGPYHPNVSTELVTLGTIELLRTSDVSRALPFFEQACRTDERFFGPTHPKLATILTSIAMLHSGHPALAEPYWRRALEVISPVPEAHLKNLVECINNLFLALRAQGKHKESLAFAEPLIARWEHDPHVPPQAITALWNGVADVYHRKGQDWKAEKFLRKALHKAEALYGKEGRPLEPLLSNLEVLLRDMGRRHEANELALRLEALHREN